MPEALTAPLEAGGLIRKVGVGRRLIVARSARKIAIASVRKRYF